MDELVVGDGEIIAENPALTGLLLERRVSLLSGHVIPIEEKGGHGRLLTVRRTGE
ncbi:MAG TPA: hypothetical protein VFD30_00100 [Terriglobia bacterium]|nr:hypothetical protein [Terriglobia bacterium]